MVECRDFNMWNMSLSMLIGKSPKVSFLCGKCDGFNEGRIPMGAVRCGRPWLTCMHCGETNYIPVQIGVDDEEDDW